MRKKFSIDMLESMCSEKDLLTKEVQSIYIGGGDGSKDNPYSMDDYYAMVDSGTWTGGYIQDSEGISYGMAETRAYGGGYTNYAGTYIGSTASYTEYTMTSFLLSMESSGWDQLAGYTLGQIPGFGDYTSYMAQEYNDTKLRLAAEASKQGYSGDDRFDYVISQAGEYTQKMSLVDTKTGKIISSETINLFGN